MPTNEAQFKRLLLQIERDLIAQDYFQALLTAVTARIAATRQALRAVKRRLKAEPKKS